MSQVVDQRSRSWVGRTLIDGSGQRIGRVEDIYTDDVGGHPAWIAVATGRFALNIIFLPFAGATPAGGDELRVQFSKDLIKEAPVAGRGGRLTQEEVVRLYDHYGFDLEAEEVRERAMHRGPSRPRASYRRAFTQEPATTEPVAAAHPPTPAAPAEDRAPDPKPAAGAATVASSPEKVAPPPLRVAVPAVTAPPTTVVAPPETVTAPQASVAAPPEKVTAPAAKVAPPARDMRLRPPSPLFRDIVEPSTVTEEADPHPDSPLFWNHDDRIDSIRPPREPAWPGRR